MEIVTVQLRSGSPLDISPGATKTITLRDAYALKIKADRRRAEAATIRAS